MAPISRTPHETIGPNEQRYVEIEKKRRVQPERTV